jgi:hypothetical protein
MAMSTPRRAKTVANLFKRITSVEEYGPSNSKFFLF